MRAIVDQRMYFDMGTFYKVTRYGVLKLCFAVYDMILSVCYYIFI